MHSLAFAPDARTLASVAGSSRRSGTVRLWDVWTGNFKGSLRGHQQAARSVSFSSDGKLIATADVDGKVRLWDRVTRRLRRTLPFDASDVAFSPRGAVLAISRNSGVSLWSTATNQVQHTLTAVRNPVRMVAFAPDGQTLASVHESGSIQLWDVRTGRATRMLEGYGGAVSSVAFASNGYLAASDGGRTIKVWHTPAGTLWRTLTISTGRVTSLAFAPNGQTLAAGGTDTSIRLWDVRAWQWQHSLWKHRAAVNAVIFSPDSRRLASGDARGTVRIWNR